MALRPADSERTAETGAAAAAVAAAAAAAADHKVLQRGGTECEVQTSTPRADYNSTAVQGGLLIPIPKTY